MRRRLAFLLAAALAVAGCGAHPPAGSPSPPDQRFVWPRPPAESRIRFVRSIATPGEAGIEKSLFRRVADVVTGNGSERLIRPTGVAERAGVLYVADPGAPAVWIFDAARQAIARVDRAGATPLASPVSIAAGRDGAVFVADSGLGKVFLLDRAGRLIRTVVDRGLGRPTGLAYDEGTGRLYVADAGADRIAVYGTNDEWLFTWGSRGRGPGEFNRPTHLALAPSGTLLVTDALNFRVQAFDRAGRFLWTLGRHGDGSGDLAAPKGVAVDAAGHVYVVDALFDTVQIFEPGGELLLAFGERGVGAGEGEFWLPGGIAINGQNRIYVADSHNHRIQVFDVLPRAE